MPPISVYRVGELHFVRDGHHRVSVARALGRDTIDAYVTEVQTAVGAGRDITLADLPLKSHERLFFERVPLPPAARERIRLRRAEDYAKLAEGVEAWGFRAIQERGVAMTRHEVAAAWLEREYVPVVAMLRDADLCRRGPGVDPPQRSHGDRGGRCAQFPPHANHGVGRDDCAGEGTAGKEGIESRNTAELSGHATSKR